MEIQLYEYHPIYGYRFVPDIRRRVEHEGGGYLIRVNGAGFRSEHEYVEDKAPDKYRVLLFGDSFTAGDGVSNKHRFGDLLENLIPGLEVYNFGLPGTGTDQHYLVYREVAERYEHDLVVIAVQVENIRRIASRYRLSANTAGEPILLAKPYFELGPDGELFLKNTPVPKAPLAPDELPEGEAAFVDRGGRLPLLRQVVNALGGSVKGLAQKVTRFQPLPEYGSAAGPEWLLMRSILRHWSDESRCPVIVMPVPLYYYVEESADSSSYRKRFDEIREWSNVTMHDPLPDFLAVPKNKRRSLRFESDVHPTPAYHQVLADSLAVAIRSVLPREKAEATRQ